MFAEEEWRAVYLVTQRQPPPDEPPSLDTLVRRVATLGGFLNRKDDGFPGPKTLWIGLQRAADFVLALEAQRSIGESSGKWYEHHPVRSLSTMAVRDTHIFPYIAIPYDTGPGVAWRLPEARHRLLRGQTRYTSKPTTGGHSPCTLPCDPPPAVSRPGP